MSIGLSLLEKVIIPLLVVDPPKDVLIPDELEFRISTILSVTKVEVEPLIWIAANLASSTRICPSLVMAALNEEIPSEVVCMTCTLPPDCTAKKLRFLRPTSWLDEGVPSMISFPPSAIAKTRSFLTCITVSVREEITGSASRPVASIMTLSAFMGSRSRDQLHPSVQA